MQPWHVLITQGLGGAKRALHGLVATVGLLGSWRAACACLTQSGRGGLPIGMAAYRPHGSDTGFSNVQEHSGELGAKEQRGQAMTSPNAEPNQSMRVPDDSLDSGIVTLPSNATVGCAAELHAQLRAALAQELPIRLSGAATEQVDAAVMQLLAAFALEAKRLSRSWEWLEPADVLRKSAILLGLAPALQLQ